jgi:hypothetical protein
MPRSFFLPAALAFLSIGCGYVGDPLPPLANIPAVVTDLKAIQRGSRIIIQFTLPTQTTEGIAIRSPLKIDLRASSGSMESFSAEAWQQRAKPLPSGRSEHGRVQVEIPSQDWTGQEITIGVRVIGENGKASEWSNFVRVPVIPPPVPPGELAAKSTAEGVLLAWKGGPGRYRVFRRAGQDAEFAPVRDVDRENWTDTTVKFGESYTYALQRVVPLPDGQEAESELSDAVTITPTDTFPPAVPAGLRVFPAPGSVELVWEPNSEPDFAEYRVYRALPSGAWKRIGVTAVPGFSDRSAEKGKVYRYAVTAADKLGNESARSAEVTGSLPQ